MQPCQMSSKCKRKHRSPRARDSSGDKIATTRNDRALRVQIVFAALNVWIGVQFYLWVRWAESGGRAFEVSRPAGVEG